MKIRVLSQSHPPGLRLGVEKIDVQTAVGAVSIFGLSKTAARAVHHHMRSGYNPEGCHATEFRRKGLWPLVGSRGRVIRTDYELYV